MVFREGGGDGGGGHRSGNISLSGSPVSAAITLGTGIRVLDGFLSKRKQPLFLRRTRVCQCK